MAAISKKIEMSARADYHQNSQARADRRPSYRIQSEKHGRREKKIYPGESNGKFKAHPAGVEKLGKIKEMYKKRRELDEFTEKRVPFSKKINPKPKKNLILELKKDVTRTTPPALELNRNFFITADAIYTSYWVGKLVNMLTRSGNKKTSAREVYRAFAIVKYSLGYNPLLLFLETLDKIKPFLRLRNYIVRRVIIKEYPIVSSRSRQFLVALQWSKAEIKKSEDAFFGQTLGQRIASKLIDFQTNPKKNNLTKKRMDYTKRIIMGQFNIRYNWRKKRY